MNKKKHNYWPLKAFVLAMVLSIVFSLSTDLVLQNGTDAIVSITTIVFFLIIALFADLIGVAVTACDKVPFLSMASKKVKGAKASLWLITRQEIVASVCGDIIGDISAIISGALGVDLAIRLSNTTGWKMIFVSAVISAIIAGFTVGGKAYAKILAIKHSHKIIKIAGRIILVFGIGEKKTKKK